MTDTETSAPKKKLSLSQPGKLELKKTVEGGQVRQNFSHGRSKVVTVEVRKKRTFAPGSTGSMAEVKPTPELIVEEEPKETTEQQVEEIVSPILNKISINGEHGISCSYFGKGGSGHFIKMVHNGIEYSMMQIIAEAYDFLVKIILIKSCNYDIN